MNAQRLTLLEGDVPQHVLRLAVPLAGGMLAIRLFSLVDAWFVSHLGTVQLAALGFTIPIVMLYMGVIFGINVGTSTALSRVYGEGDMPRFKRMATDAIVLSVITVTAASVLGFALIVPVFRLLGAGADTMPYIWRYMAVWYCSLPFMGLMMIGNACIRATGNTHFPSAVMIGMAILNIIFDPLFIFGWGIFPRMELTGAAVTQVISCYLTSMISIFVLIFREQILEGPIFHKKILESWRAIMQVAVPSMISNQTLPISAAIITWLAAGFGEAAVAALGVATRIEAVATLVFYSMGAGVSIFVGQNFGAGNYGRIQEATFAGMKYAFIWGVFMALGLWVFASDIPRLFDDHPDVIAYTAQYLHWVPLSYPLLALMVVCNARQNSTGQPFRATFMIFLKAVIIYLPLAWVAQQYLGFFGIMVALMITNAIVGLLALAWSRQPVA
ncbi:MAG TPA: MATE family efflux transporter [Alphaproteobacteria bacterium]|nr:MATE family efflux transporter [Alphaproteobacteria bacterium]